MADSLNELLARVRVPDVVDAMGRMHRHRCHILDLASPTPGRVLFGPAVTISYFPTCEAVLDSERFTFARLFYQAIGDDPAGRVLVLASNGHPEASLAGGQKLSRVHHQRLAGVLTDGRLRDFHELASYEFATFCRGEAVRWGGDVVTPHQANVPVVVRGVGIFPGDYIHADTSGAVVVPGAEIGPVLEEAVRIAEDDARYRQAVARETPDAPSGQ
jgi:regulator of RNase E activity RraA